MVNKGTVTSHLNSLSTIKVCVGWTTCMYDVGNTGPDLVQV
jgi:hypothetical protein